jgi:hypothetical protein
MKMTSNGKTLNYKVVDLIESYNFHIKFTSIRVQTKKIKVFENRLDPYRRGHGGSRCYNTARAPNAVGHDGGSLPPFPTTLDVQFYKFFPVHIFFKKMKEKCKKKKIFTTTTRC